MATSVQGISLIRKCRTGAPQKRLRRHLEDVFRDVDPSQRKWMWQRGKWMQMRRDAVWFAKRKDGMLPLYRTHAHAKGDDPRAHLHRVDDVPVPKEMKPVLSRLCDDLWSEYGLKGTPNHVVLHRYVDGGDQITYHHDKWMDQEPGSHIACLSLGETRTFQIGDKDTHAQLDFFEVKDGDLVTLSYEANQTYKHQVRRTRRNVGVRYSVTIRCMDTMYDPKRKLIRTRNCRVPATYKSG